MDAAALVAAFRQRSDDAVEPYLWDDATVLSWLAEAEREACVRAKLIYDDTSAFLSVPLTADTDLYAMDPRIDRIDQVTYVPATGNRTFPVELVGVDALQTWCPVSYYRAARVQNTLHLYPVPKAGGALKIACYRYPLADIELMADEPEIPAEHHEKLVDWMLYRAFSTHDADTDNLPRAQLAQAQFTAWFGERNSASVERKHRERRRITTRMV